MPNQLNPPNGSNGRRVDKKLSPSVLIVGNYPGDGQYSMQLFARTLLENLIILGTKAELAQPPNLMARILPRRFSKIAGYLDKYALFPVMLRWKARKYDCVHIIDHSNSPYRLFVGRKPVVITCHDMFAVKIMLGEVPGQRFGWSGKLLQKWVLSNLRRNRFFTSVTEQSAEDLREISETKSNVPVIPNALSEIYCDTLRMSNDYAPEFVYKQQDRFFLHVGGNNYYKNRPGVVSLFEYLASTDKFRNYNLILAGKAPDENLRRLIEKSPVSDKIKTVINADDKTIKFLYEKADALLFISLAEGFGWPIIEAQSCGCPVVTSDREPMRTIAGGAALLISPDDIPHAAKHIAEHFDEIPKIREAGLINASRYRPEKVFPQYLSIYRHSVECA